MVVTLQDGTVMVIGSGKLKFGSMEFVCNSQGIVSAFEARKVMGSEMYSVFVRWMDGQSMPNNGYFGRDIRRFMLR